MDGGRRVTSLRRQPQPAAGAAWELSHADLYLFNEGTHRGLADKLGAHSLGPAGTAFAVWAPSARSVSVVGDFNGWDHAAHPLDPVASSGIWAGVVPDAAPGHVYKYAVTTTAGAVLEKADPYAFAAECPPRTGSLVWDLDYDWGDGEWMATRDRRGARDAPVSIYEVHLGSWRRPSDDPTGFLSYEELAPLLIDHVHRTGFTHVEFLPVMEHPFYGSWGYQTTGYFAPTARYGTPQGLMALIDQLHQAGIGILLDWVPSHFPTDAFALGEFDGTHLYEHADPRQGFHPDWTSYIFNYGRNEVRSFLLSSAEHWLSTYHVDGLRVDAVASMLYLDYSRAPGEWVPNRHGGRDNLDAIEFLRQLNIGVYGAHPDVQTVAEESTAWPGVSRPTDAGGLGFGYKWDMGWMHDTLEYLRRDPVHRRYHHDQITFRGLYAFTENYVLPLSHDEVVHGKGSLLGGMPGDDWQKFANLRLLYGYQFAQPGKKLLFMGDELGQWQEWSHERCLEWRLLDYARHCELLRWVGDLNHLYREEPALHELDCEPSGFEWVEVGDAGQSTLGFLRRSAAGDSILVISNFTPVPRHHMTVGVPDAGLWREILNSDARAYGGSGVGNPGQVESVSVPYQGKPYSLRVTAPPLAVVFLRREIVGPP
ncbi:MAG TPA: 1,4-alpha-glucan branching protein GlgB [Acidimicrobiales bacterium]|nr:1,4-alpha-glucan branching protein GlgB [Acidimicrobiales bacterium]